MGMVSGERVFKVLDTNEFISDSGTEDLATVRGDLSFENVWFSYKDHPANEHNNANTINADSLDEEWVLKDLSFKVEAGQTLALVGATGAGKSSIVNLISRLYEFQKGKISLDGKDIRTIKLEQLRKNVGMVLQDVFLFSDTIANNISLKDPEISLEQIIEASKSVGAHRFIERLPGAYNFNVMERGSMLSTGQRQLISFIRAYVYDPAILILDEATSSIDHESEELIKEATTKLTRNRTSIIIAHRLATIQNADKIIVMDKGRVVETGTHQELLRIDGMYKQLYEIQFSGMES